MEQPLQHSERCRWLNVAHIPERVCFNSGINLQSATQAIASLNSLPYFNAICHCPLQYTTKMCLWKCEMKQGTALLLTFMNPTKDMQLGPDSPLHCVQQLHTAHSLQLLGNPVSKTWRQKAISALISPIQVRFHLFFQEVIIHRGFIPLSPVITSPLKHTMAFKKCFSLSLCLP